MITRVLGLRQSLSRVAHAFALVVLVAGVPACLAATEFRGVRLNVSDPQSAAEWYATHLGGTIVPIAPDTPTVSEGDARRVQLVRFGKTTLEFFPVYVAPPIWPVLGSVGSGVDHLGFAYANLDQAMARFAKSGVEIVSGIEREGPIRYAFIRDRWGTLIELVEDREIQGFHHVHLATTDRKATLKWYTEVLGGRVTLYAGVLPGIHYGDAWILVKTVKSAPAPTEGRAIDRLDWSVSTYGELLPRLTATRLPHTTRQVTRETRQITIAGPDRVQLSILAAGR